MNIWLVIMLSSLSLFSQAQSIESKGKTVDEKTGEGRSIAEIFERDGKVHGKVIKLFSISGERPDPNSDERRL